MRTQQLLVSRVTGDVVLGRFHFSGNGVYPDMTFGFTSKWNYHKEMSRQFVHVYGAAFAAALLTFLVGQFAFRWLLISYQTWRLGHPNPFVIGPEIDAAMLAVVTAAIVFWLVV